MNKVIVASLIFIMLAIGGMYALLHSNTNSPATIAVGNTTNVTTLDGTQQIQINAKGGYLPHVTRAKANMPTVINVTTDGTYDCSSSLNIPSIGFRKSLPASGTTPIEIPPQKPGTSLKGVCGMGMYNFAVNFN